MSVTLYTLNTKGLGGKQKRLQVFQYLKDKSYDVIFLQETHYNVNTCQTWKTEWKGKSFFSGLKSNKEGVAFLVNESSNINCSAFTELVPGRIIVLDIEINNKDITLINIYGPNDDKTYLFDTLEAFITNNKDKNIILAGDFNTVLNPSIEKKNGRKDTSKKCQISLNNLIFNNNLIDIWRENNPNLLQYTWHSNTKPVIFSRLDYFLISEYLKNTIPKCKIKPGYKSDHSAVILTFNTLEQNKGPGYFKINNSIINDNLYKNQIENAINETIETNNNSNPNILWELIKGTIRNVSIKYSSYMKKEKEKREKELINNIEQLQGAYLIDNNDDVLEEINTLKQELDIIINRTSKWNDIAIKIPICRTQRKKKPKFFAKASL